MRALIGFSHSNSLPLENVGSLSTFCQKDGLAHVIVWFKDKTYRRFENVLTTSSFEDTPSYEMHITNP